MTIQKIKTTLGVVFGTVALGYGLGSCSLDEKFYSEVTPETFFTNPTSVYSVLARPFTQWKGYVGNDRWYLQELTTDEMTCPQRGADWYNGGEYFRLHYHTWNPDDRFIVNTYNETMSCISRTLESIADLSQVDYESLGLTETDKENHIYQLKALQAYFLKKGLDYFGGLPLYESNTDELKARSTDKETFAYIEQLLKEAIPHLTKKTKLGDKEDGFITQAAAASLLAQLYFNANAYIGEAHFEKPPSFARTSSTAITARISWMRHGGALTDSTMISLRRSFGLSPLRKTSRNGTGISNISITTIRLSILIQRPQGTMVLS